MPQGIPRPEHLVTGPLHDLVHALHDLYDAAGRPSTRLVSSAVRKRSDLRDTVSHETVSAMLKGSGVPKWVKLECVVIFLAGIAVDQPDRITTVRHFRDLWLAASRSTNSPYDQGGISIDSAGQIIRKTNPEPAEPPIRSALGTESSSEIPPRNPYFTGRSRVLRRINDFFDRGELLTTVIGMGGTGKTQLAIEYLHRYRDSYDLIWWANSETSSRLRASLSALGTILSLPASTPMHHPPTQVLAALSRSNLRWLLVLDNAIAPGDLPEFESSGSGHVLVTSRDPGWIHQGSVVELDVLERSESVELFRRRGATTSESELDLLAERLGDLPLAVDHAATWSVTPITDLMTGIRSGVHRSPTMEDEAGVAPALHAFLRFAFTNLATTAPAAMELYEMFGFLGAEPVTLTLLQAGRSGNVTPPLKTALQQLLPDGNSAVRDLLRHGLARLTRVERRPALQTHRLFQEFLRGWMTPERTARARSNVHAILAAANPGDPDDTRFWGHYAEVGAHVDAADIVRAQDFETRRVALDQVRYLYRRGDYLESLALCERLVASPSTTTTDRDGNFSVLARHHLANAMRMLGKYSQAERITREEIARVEQLHPAAADEHFSILEMDRAFNLRLAGRYSEALEVDQRNLERLLRDDLVEHDRIRFAQNSIAVNLRLLGRFSEAHDRDLELVRDWETAHGKNDPRTLFASTNLARDLYGLGRFREALRTTLNAVAPYQRVVGTNHRGVLLAVRTEGMCRRQLGEYQAATDLLARNCRDVYTWFDTQHEYAVAATISLANCLVATNDLVSASRKVREALEICTEIFGPEHVLTMAATVSTASVSRAMGEYRSARRSDERAAATLAATLGPNHPSTLAASHNLAVDLALLGETRPALERGSDVLQRGQGSQDPTHPDSLVTAINVALLKARIRDSVVASAQFEAHLASYRSLVRPDHPRITAAQSGTLLELDIEVPPS